MTPTSAQQRMLAILEVRYRQVEDAIKHGTQRDFALATKDLAEDAQQLAREAERTTP